jgi:hypothetical protein
MLLKLRTRMSLIVLGGILASALCAPSAASGLCGHTTLVRNYLAQVEGSTPVKEVPISGQLSFAPKSFHLDAIGKGMLVGSSQVGFRLHNRSTEARRLNLVAESELVKVTARGRVITGLGIKRRSIGSIQGDRALSLSYRVPASPAYYRIDIRFFRKGMDQGFGRYSFYARVMKPSIDLRVRIVSSTVGPGEVARAIILNLGTVPLIARSYDYGFSVQRYAGEKWIFVPDNPRRLVPKRMGPWTLGAGMKNHGCLRYLVPADQASGLFRFVFSGSEAARGILAAEFHVASVLQSGDAG